jgi:vacuolar protein sorting-associated protein 41
MESNERSDPVEPLFKYLRIACDLREIVKNTSISCISVSSKVIFVGTSWGDLHVLDHEGNVNYSQKFPKHIVAINQISIDDKGEYVATVSDDGQVSFVEIVFCLES